MKDSIVLNAITLVKYISNNNNNNINNDCDDDYDDDDDDINNNNNNNRKSLHDVEEGIATLQAKYDDCVRKKDELEMKCQQCEGRLVRADKVKINFLNIWLN